MTSYDVLSWSINPKMDPEVAERGDFFAVKPDAEMEVRARWL